jgi:2-polyprenyl-3-methyl-5-hydroxy-6-metoxy-1,4-benzoquinol methylase
MSLSEKDLQESFEWARSKVFSDYNSVLAYYQAAACLEHAHGESLLDMPCGDGMITALLAPRFKKVVGIDASSVHLAIARKTLPAAEFHETLIENFSSPHTFDTIAMLNILEHVVDPVLVLKKASGLLRDNGVLLIHVPNAYAINRRLAVLMGTLLRCDELSPFDVQVAGHRRSYSMASLCEDIHKAGLKIFMTGGVFYKTMSTPQMDWFLKNGPWKEGGFGWGRVGGERKDWKAEFCRASYELGKKYPEDCNIIYACATL